ncbi:MULTISPECIES: methyltransferase [Clostridium]|uniref:methyltransferase n=1 Tax=Clostridium TaxID=1485 RepID=UPI00082509CF|nr:MULTISPECIES: methyltransferase [Clostridium]PJI09598.1 methyltransferase [Clostridium sp. CT7]
MDKILVSIYVPSIGCSYDVYIPLKSKFYEIVRLVTSIIEELSEGYFIGDDDSVLCDRITGAIYNVNMSSAELGLKNGSKLMLI